MELLRPLLMLLLTAVLAAGEEPKTSQDPAKGGTQPKPIKREVPRYPDDLRHSGFTGRVMVEFIIDTKGEVINPVVVRSNNPWFERPAIEALLKWKFEPGTVGGKKVNVRSLQLIEFTWNNSMADKGLWNVPRQKNPGEFPEELRWDEPPQPVNTAFPVYPFDALRAGLSGKTQINFMVGPDGLVMASDVVEASNPEMGLAALAMIDTWEFTPPKKKNGQPCYAALTMKHEFKPRAGDVPVSREARQILRLLEKTPGEIVPIRELDQAPKPQSRRAPTYPAKLLKIGQPGQAVIEFFIDQNGDAQLPHVISSSAPEFGYAAMQAVATWRFEPVRKGGKVVVTRVQIPIEFAPKKAG